MSIQFVDQPVARKRLLPLTYTRPIADLRVGILTIAEKWKKYLDRDTCGFSTEEYLQKKYPSTLTKEDTYWIFNGVLPNRSLVNAAKKLKSGQAIYLDDQILIAKGKEDPQKKSYEQLTLKTEVDLVEYPWNIFQKNGNEIRLDFDLITEGRKSHPLQDPHTKVYGQDIFIESDVNIKAAILNAENGPIYIGNDCEIQEGAIIRGPFAMGEHSVVNMGAKVRGDSSMGPHCKIGGEVSNSVLWGYSNKGHDGFLGNAVLGQWCNLGADTNNSNLKNNYDPVRFWEYESETFFDTGLQFCGLVMGDHSKTGINTMFNTGTSVGVAANIFGAGFPKTFIQSFSWGGAEDTVTHHVRKALITARKVMGRRNIELDETEKDILNHIFEQTAQFRKWEN